MRLNRNKSLARRFFKASRVPSQPSLGTRSTRRFLSRAASFVFEVGCSSHIDFKRRNLSPSQKKLVHRRRKRWSEENVTCGLDRGWAAGDSYNA
jgi:hypothetical protein